MFLSLIVFKSSLIDFRQFNVVYLNYIKKISAYAIKSLAHVKVLKNATLLSLILQIFTKECVLNWDLLLALLYTLKKYSNSMPNSNLLQLNRLTNTITTRLIEHIVAVVEGTAEGTTNVNYKAIVEVLIKVHSKVIARRSATFVKS